MRHTTGSESHFVQFDLDVKSWEKSPPSVRECRPPRCPICATSSVLPCGKVMLHGHGVRARQRWGLPDPEPGTAAEIGTLVQRRYRCQQCRPVTVVVVRPRAELSHRRYTASAIVLALWLWGCDLLTDAAVQSRSSPWGSCGVSRPERWTTLRRWADAARDGRLWSCTRGDASWTLRQCAERAARVIEALADVAIGPPHRRVFAGVVHAR